MLPGGVFPFARCEGCDKIFVVAKRPSRYHSRECAADKNRDRIRKQTRQAVARHRARKKAAAHGRGFDQGGGASP
jgi:hypothetical protein